MGFTFVFVLATVSDASFPQWKSTRYTLAGGAAVGDWSAADKPLSSPILQAELGEATATAMWHADPPPASDLVLKVTTT